MRRADIFKYLARWYPAEAIRIQHCRGCQYLGLCGISACCDYIEMTGKVRPCPAGEQCTVKILLPGKWPTEAQHNAEIQKLQSTMRQSTLERLGQKAKLRQKEYVRDLSYDEVQDDTPKKRGRRLSWDSEYGKRLYLDGFTANQVSYIMDVPLGRVSAFVRRYNLTDERRKKHSRRRRRTDGETEREYIKWHKIKQEQISRKDDATA